MIKIIDYGLGNVKAFLNVYKRLNIAASVARNSQELLDADRLILPGVGSFDHAMNMLQRSGMRELLDNMVLVRGIPVLGICVGMQIMAERSEEGVLPGLGWINASVRKMRSTIGKPQLLLPHMGWNDVSPLFSSPLFAGLDEDMRFYFLHSYFFDCKSSKAELAVTNYGYRFASAVNLKNIYGVQFHPEKSHHYGARLLKNFSEI